MKRIIALLLCALLMGASGCGGSPAAENKRNIVCTTYPIYLFARALTDGVETFQVARLDTGGGGCLHDYTLSMTDMKKIEQADILAINGAELEEFMEDALAASDAMLLDCSAGVELLENLSHHHHEEGEEGHDHGHYDPHYWMDPANAKHMVENLRDILVLADGDNAVRYEENADRALAALDACLEETAALLDGTRETIGGLITFHDGFQYFARAYGMPLLESIEEEAGSEASAKEIVEITELVREYDLPAIFTEVNGSDATARAIGRETGCAVVRLSMCMDGPAGGVEEYTRCLRDNITAIARSFGEEGAK